MKTCTKCGDTKSLEEFHKLGKGHRPRCKSCRKTESSSYYVENSDEIKKKVKSYNWKKRFPDRHAALENKRRASKLNATPSWLSKEQLEEIQYFYWLSKDLERTTGMKYHVDHIIPLQGEGITGLHVPWNLQVLPSEVNLSKSNKVEHSVYAGRLK